MSKSYPCTLSGLMSALLDDTFFSDPIWREFFDTTPVRFNPNECSNAYPVSNKYVDPETKELHIECALTGVSEDEFVLDVVDGDKIVLDIHRSKGDDTKKDVQLQHGLRYVEDSKVSWSFNPRYNDISKAKVTYENGLLSIVVPPAKEVTTTKTLFGNYKAIEQKPSKKIASKKLDEDTSDNEDVE